jgi:acyl-coenzyme A thioesterase PaaI-like protein
MSCPSRSTWSAARAFSTAARSAGCSKWIKPINLTVDYMRGGRDKPTRARGTVTRLGTRVANVEAVAWQDEPDRPIAAARMNYLIVR